MTVSESCPSKCCSQMILFIDVQIQPAYEYILNQLKQGLNNSINQTTSLISVEQLIENIELFFWKHTTLFADSNW